MHYQTFSSHFEYIKLINLTYFTKHIAILMHRKNSIKKPLLIKHCSHSHNFFILAEKDTFRGINVISPFNELIVYLLIKFTSYIIFFGLLYINITVVGVHLSNSFIY